LDILRIGDGGKVLFKVKFMGDKKYTEPYQDVEAENAKAAAEMWYGASLAESGSLAKLRVHVKRVVNGMTSSALFYEP